MHKHTTHGRGFADSLRNGHVLQGLIGQAKGNTRLFKVYLLHVAAKNACRMLNEPLMLQDSASNTDAVTMLVDKERI